MTELSKPSSEVSTLDGQEYLNQRLADLSKWQQAKRGNDLPQPVAASIPSLPTSRRSPGSKTPVCKKSQTAGYLDVIEAAGRVGESHRPRAREVWEVDEQDERLERNRKAYIAAGCPKLHTLHGAELDFRASPTGWLEARAKIVGKLGGGFTIALIGHRGPGKTQLAQQAIQAACQQGMTALYARVMDLFYDLRATYGTDLTERSVVEHYRRPHLLVFDELHDRKESLWEDRTLHDLIDRRHGDLACTLLIGNLTEEGFEESMGPTITERLRETGAIVDCSWESFRK